MTKPDYEKLGLKCGLEIHQQLDTDKLFCSCHSIIRDDAPDFYVSRQLRSVAGETGEVDVAAAHEHGKSLLYVYEGYKNTTCLVELDEEPIRALNKEALEISLQVSLMLNAKVVDQIHVMRKTVVDGSNTSGFQRTALVAVDGNIKTSFGSVGIPAICLEEDSAKIISQDSKKITYRLDRLGTPLIEIGTAPDIKTPEQVKEVAEYLGMVLRSTGKVKRGLGTIRQDVNVSIKGGERIEIKGAQELKLLPKLVEYECIRQMQLIAVQKSLPSFSPAQNHDLSKLLKSSKNKVIAGALQIKGIVAGVKLAGFAGLLGKEVQPGRRFGSELSDYAKVKAGVHGLFHSDELPQYGITQEEVDMARKALSCGAGDAFIIVADSAVRAKTALDAAFERVRLAYSGVPAEVRKANDDGTTSYLRPMPGAARMYPETDAVPVKPDVRHLLIPELLSSRSARVKEKYGLSRELSDSLLHTGKIAFFEGCCSRFTALKPSYIAETLLTAEKQVQQQFDVAVALDDDDFETVFAELSQGQIAKDSVLEILGKKGKMPLKEAVRLFQLIDDKTLETRIAAIAKQHEGLAFNALIGRVMAELKGKADGRKIAELTRKFAQPSSS